MIRNKLLVAVIAIMALILAACDTGDTANQSTSAQNFQPNIAGFKTQNADNIVETFADSVAAVSVTTGNVPLAATIERIGTTIECLNDVGAVSAMTYVQEENIEIVPQAGLSLVVNVDRVERNILRCVTDLPFGAQTLTIEPCAETGTFTVEGEEFYYAYIGAGTELCSAFNQHFQTYNPTVETTTQ